MNSKSIATKLPNGGWVDHIVWGTPDTQQAVTELGERTGVTANLNMAPDENYPTLSAAINLGGETFLEIYGPNPGYSGPKEGLYAILSALQEPRLLAWFIRTNELTEAANTLKGSGETLQPMLDEWERTDLPAFRNGFVVGENFNPSIPYIIQWRDRYDMDERLQTGLRLADFKVYTADLSRTQALHAMLGISVDVEAGDHNGFTITLESPKGSIRLD
ncbi:MAG: VOC family protein [Pseudomonadota bacterium]